MTKSDNMNQRIRDSVLFKQLRSAVGWEETENEPATQLEEIELGLDSTKPKAALLNGAFLREKKLKLFMYAQDKYKGKDGSLVELRAELSQLSPVQVTIMSLCHPRHPRPLSPLSSSHLSR